MSPSKENAKNTLIAELFRTDSIAPLPPAGYIPHIIEKYEIDEDISPIIANVDSDFIDELNGITFMIVYQANSSYLSHRRITIRKIYRSKGLGYIKARCHERNAERSFRIDRISEIIDGNGELHDVFSYFYDNFKLNIRG
jgi:hypothetical protein